MKQLIPIIIMLATSGGLAAQQAQPLATSPQPLAGSCIEYQDLQAARLQMALSSCTFNGKNLWGKVQVVDAFPDIKVQYVDAFPDLKVQWVSAFPDDCGEWQEVDAFPDFKIQLVDAFPDIKVQRVDAFPGLP